MTAPAITVAAGTGALEAGTNGTFTVSRTGTTGDLVVTYAVGGSASTGADFTALPGSVTILDGQTSATVTVLPKQDYLVEGTKTVLLSIIPQLTYSAASPLAASINLTDDDNTSNPTITVTASGSPSEAGSTTGTFKINRGSNTTGDLTIYYSMTTGAGNAINSLDYQRLTGSVVIPNGSTFVNVTVTPIDDALDEGSENVTLQVTSNALYTGTPSATLNITDNDTATTVVTVAATDASASEQDTDKGVFTFTRNGTGAALTVNYTVGGTATGTSNTDYTSLSGVVTIPNGSSTVQVNVLPVDDSAKEGSETVVITLSSGSYSIGSPSGATVTITDNEPTVTVSATDSIAAELAFNPGVFTIRRDNSVGTLVVNYSMSGSTTSTGVGADYTSLPGSVTFLNGQASVTVTVCADR